MSRSYLRSGALVLGLGLASAGVWSATPIAPKTLGDVSPLPPEQHAVHELPPPRVPAVPSRKDLRMWFRKLPQRL